MAFGQEEAGSRAVAGSRGLVLCSVQAVDLLSHLGLGCLDSRL